MRRRNKSNWKVFKRLDQSGELLCNVRSNLDADEHASGLDCNIGAGHGSDGGLHGLDFNVCMLDDCKVVVAWAFVVARA
jgi:hypothetical protein